MYHGVMSIEYLLLSTLIVLSLQSNATTVSVGNSDYTCPNPGESCTMTCDSAGEFYAHTYHCGQASDCYFNCAAKHCTFDATIDATNASNFYLIGSDKACLLNTDILTPKYGNATFTMSNAVDRAFKKMNVWAGAYAQNIVIDLDTSTDDDQAARNMKV